MFDKDSLVTTQNIRPGVLRMREELSKVSYKTYQLEEIVEEMVIDRLQSFKQMFVGDRTIENIILVDDYVSLILQKGILKSGKEGHVDAQTFQEFVGRLKQRNSQEIAAALGIPAENTSLLYLSAIMIKHMMKVLGLRHCGRLVSVCVMVLPMNMRRRIKYYLYHIILNRIFWHAQGILIRGITVENAAPEKEKKSH